MGDSGETTEVELEDEELLEDETEDNSTAITNTSGTDDGETITTADADADDELEVGVTVSPPAQGSFASDETVDIHLGAFEEQNTTPVGLENETLNVTAVSPAGDEQHFEVETDAEGSATVEYDPSDAEEINGIHEVTVEAAEADVSTGVAFQVGPIVSVLDSGPAIVNEERTVNAHVFDGKFGVANEPVEILITQDDETVASETVETDDDGFAGLEFTPEASEDYDIEAEIDSGDTDSSEIVASDVILGSSGSQQAVAGEEASYGNYLRTADGPLANTNITVNLTEQFTDDEFTHEADVRTDESGFFLVEYDLPEDVEQSLQVRIGTEDGDQVEIQSESIFVTAPVDDDDGDDDDDDSDDGDEVSEPELNANTDDFRYGPGEEVEITFEAQDEEPIEGAMIDLFLKWDFSGAPAFSRTVETDEDGIATVTVTIPEDAPDGVSLRGEAAFEHEDTVVDTFFGVGVQEVEIDFDREEIVPGEPNEVGIEVTETATGDDVEGIPTQFVAFYSDYKSEIYATGQLETDEEGTDSVVIDTPLDLGPTDRGTEYIDQYRSGLRSPQINHPGDLTVETEDEDDWRVTPGEELSLEFETPDDEAATGVALGLADRTVGTEIAAGEPVTLTVPEEAEDGDFFEISVMTADENGQFYTDQEFFSVEAPDEEVENITVEGALELDDGTAASNDTVVVFDDKTVELTTTDEDGEFDVDVPESDSEYAVGYYQGTFSEENVLDPDDELLDEADNLDDEEIAEAFEDAFPRDGSADIYGVETISGAENVSIDSEIPIGHVLNITVVDDGQPVENAGVIYAHENDDTGGFASVGTVTDANGTPLVSDDGGLEVNGSVSVAAVDSEDFDRFAVEEFDVTEDREVEIDIAEEVDEVTIDGAFELADGEAAAGDTVVAFNEETVELTTTDEDGEFDVDVPESESNYTVGYYQGEFTEEDLVALEDEQIDDVAEFQELFEDAFPRDGSADIYGVTEVDGTENTTLETVDIPVGHVVNTTVVDGGEPVEEAGVIFVDVNEETDGFADVGTLTDEDGVAQFSPDGGLELNGTVLALAFDPEEDDEEALAANEIEALEDDDGGDGGGVGSAFAELNITEDEDIILDLAEGGLVADLELTAEPTEADVNETEVELTLEGVEDEDEIPGYAWDLTGDGELDTDTTEPKLNHTFEELGERDVTVELGGDTVAGSASTTVDVVDTVDPVAELEVPEEVTVGETITANASESTDNHRIAEYTWELTDAEGETVETETTEEPVWNVTTEAAGEYTLAVTVTDESGNEDAASEDVSVVDAAAVEVDLEADAEQNIREEVTADVVVSNVGSQAVDEPFDVELQANGTTYEGDVVTETVEEEVEELGPEDSETLTFDLSEWAEDERVVGELSLTAEAELDEDEVAGEAAIDTAVIEIVYADLVASSDVSDVSQGENATLRSYVGNNGTAASEEADVSVSVTDADADADEDPVFENDSITADALEPEGLQRDRFTESFDEPGTYTLTVEVEDGLFPEGTESTTDFEVEPYELEVDEEATNVPSEVNRGQNFTAVFGYETNTGEDVNATLELPEEIGFAGEEEGDTETVTARSRAGGTNIVTYDLTAEERTEEPVDLNFSVEDTLELDVTDNTTAQTNVSIATETVTNESAVTYDEDVEGPVETVVEVYGDEVSEDHNVSISAQAGPEGRTLQGLEYLVNYPYGCVEQTTSAFLGALNTHQYYEDRDDADISDDRQEVINGSIEQGVDRLAEDGIRTQQDDGSWNQWGNEWQDGQSYFSVLALYGLSQVDNDDTYGPERLDDVRFNEAVDWLDDEDNWADADGYLNDEPSAIGFAIISLEEAAESDRTNEETAETIDEIYADAAEELLEQQDNPEANSGTWNDENHRSTAFAVYGLQIILDADAYEDDQQEDIEEAVESGAAFLADEQNEDDGSWEPYHDSPWWNNQGDISKSTALSVLALDAVDDETYADEVTGGVDYLMDVYENDGSWGYPRATNMALEALIELTDEQADRTMDVTLENEGEEVSSEITVNATEPQVTETISDGELEELRGENDELNEVTVTVEDTSDNGSGTAVVAVQTTQEVHDDAIENGGDE